VDSQRVWIYTGTVSGTRVVSPDLPPRSERFNGAGGDVKLFFTWPLSRHDGETTFSRSRKSVSLTQNQLQLERYIALMLAVVNLTIASLSFALLSDQCNEGMLKQLLVVSLYDDRTWKLL
jgi:hypothetical protein